MAEKLIKCSVCGRQNIAESAKTCPGCGAKNKTPFYKKLWVWVIEALFVIFKGC
jgi:ribosomal protein L37E